MSDDYEKAIAISKTTSCATTGKSTRAKTTKPSGANASKTRFGRKGKSLHFTPENDNDNELGDNEIVTAMDHMHAAYPHVSSLQQW